MKAEFSVMKGTGMSGRTALLKLGKDFPRLSVKEAEALLLVHPYVDGLTHVEAAKQLGISRASLEGRLHNAYKKIPWLQEDMSRKRKEENSKRRSLEYPSRFGDMSGVGNDGTNDTFFGEKIIGKF